MKITLDLRERRMKIELDNKELIKLILKLQSEVYVDIYDDGLVISDFTNIDIIDLISDKMDKAQYVLKVTS
jgi:hypothetical protein